MSVLRALWEVIVSPDRYFRRLEETEDRRALLLPYVIGSLAALAKVFCMSEVLFPQVPTISALVALDLPLAVLWWTGLTAAIHGLAWVLGARGKRLTTLQKFYGYAGLPMLLAAVPFILTMRAAVGARAGSVDGVASVLLLILGSLGVAVWTLVLSYKAIRYAYGLNGETWPILIASLFVTPVVMALFLHSVSPNQVTAAGFIPMSARIPADSQWDRAFTAGSGFQLALFGGNDAGLRHGSLVLIPATGRFNVVRVIGLPGDNVQFEQRTVIIDGYNYSEPYAFGDRRAAGLDGQVFSLGPDDVLVLGDNRDLPPESYGGGVIPRDRIAGRFAALEAVVFGWIVK